MDIRWHELGRDPKEDPGPVAQSLLGASLPLDLLQVVQQLTLA
jgi:hypothetical protein